MAYALPLFEITTETLINTGLRFSHVEYIVKDECYENAVVTDQRKSFGNLNISERDLFLRVCNKNQISVT